MDKLPNFYTIIKDDEIENVKVGSSLSGKRTGSKDNRDSFANYILHTTLPELSNIAVVEAIAEKAFYGFDLVDKIKVIKLLSPDEIRELLPQKVKYNDREITYKNGMKHSYDDQPALIMGPLREWYREGLLHRDNDKPARTVNTGIVSLHYSEGMTPEVRTIEDREWWLGGKRHRDGDLPAVMLSNGTMLWYNNGRLNRCGYNFAVIIGNCVTDKIHISLDGETCRDFKPGDRYIAHKGKIYN